MKGLNQVQIIGGLGNDPDVKVTQNGIVITNLSVATNESWKDQQGQQQERTEWHRIVMYRRLAEIARDYLSKGDKVFIQGKLQTRKWQDKDGQDRYTTEIVANEMQMLGGGGNGANNTNDQSGNNQARSNNNNQARSNNNNQARSNNNNQAHQNAPAPQYQEPSFDDDIGF